MIRGELQRTRDDDDDEIDGLFQPPFDFTFHSQEELLDKMVEQLTEENKGEVPVIFICNHGNGFQYVIHVRHHSMASPLFVALARHLHHNRTRVIDADWFAMFLAMAQGKTSLLNECCISSPPSSQGPVNYFPHASDNRELDCSLQSRVWRDVSKSIETFFQNTQHPVSLLIYQDPLAHISLRYSNTSGEEIALFSLLETTFKHMDFIKKDVDVAALENELEALYPQDALDALDAFDEEEAIPYWKAMERIKPKLLEIARLALN